MPPGEFNAALLQGARTLMVERYPSEAEIPLDALAATPFPKLVVTGAHSAAFDAVCDVLEERLPRSAPSSRAPATRSNASARRSTTLLADFVTRSS